MFEGWRQLLPEERFQFLYLPLVVAILGAVAGAVAAYFLLEQEQKGFQPKLVDSWVVNGPSYNPEAYVEIKTGNRGDQRAVFTRLETRVIRSSVLSMCLGLGEEGTLETGRYGIGLPAMAPQGFRRTSVLNQEIGPDRVDRFRVKFETPGLKPGQSSIYELELSAELAETDLRLPLGRYVVMTPQALFRQSQATWLASPAQGQALLRQGFQPLRLESLMKCYHRNLEGLQVFFGSSGKRSHAVARLIRSARGIS